MVGDEETFPTTYHLSPTLTDKYQTFNQMVLRLAHFQSWSNSVLNQSVLLKSVVPPDSRRTKNKVQY